MTDDADSNRSAPPGEHANIISRLDIYSSELSQLDAKVAAAQAAVQYADAALYSPELGLMYAKPTTTHMAMQRATATLEGLIAERDEVLRRARVARGLLHPIRRMPDELLQAIFAEHRAEVDRSLRGESNPSWQKLKRSPFILPSVARGWRRVALATPSHWSRIVLIFDELWEESRASALLHLHLDRSGGRELMIVIVGTPKNHAAQIWLRAHITGTFHELMSTLLISHVGLKVLSLLETEHFPRLQAVCFRDAVKLEDVDDDGDEEEPAQNVFFRNAPMLRSFNVSSWRMDWSLFTPHQGLLSLAIMEDGYGPDMDALRTIAKQAPQIEDLIIIADVLDSHNISADAPLVLLASLERIILLTAVHAESGYRHLLRLPELRRATLRIELDDAGADATTAFLRNSLPQLEQCKLQYLQIQEVRADQALANVFQQLGALEELSFISSSHTPEFCHALSIPYGGKWPLPMLQYLDMKQHGYWRPPGAMYTSMDVGSELSLLSMIQGRQSVAQSTVLSAPALLKHCKIAYANADKLLLDFDRHLHAAMVGQLDLDRL